MSELEKQAAKEFLEAAAKIPDSLRPAALEKANTYMSGLSDMAALVSDRPQPEQKEGS